MVDTIPAVKVAKFASESSGHWYSSAGEQIESVLKADKKGYTKPTLLHARKNQWAPGCTTIINSAHKEQLVVWMKKQVALAACRLPRLDSEGDSDYVRRLMEASDEVRDVSAEEGTAIHAALQCHFRDEPILARYQPHVDGAVAMLERICGKQTWRSEVCVVSPFGYATKLDLVSDEWLIDWKSKDSTQAELDALETYNSHWQQLAAGRAAARKPRLRCAIAFQSRTVAGACAIVEIPEGLLTKGWEMFKGLLHYWQNEKDYRPEWATKVFA